MSLGRGRGIKKFTLDEVISEKRKEDESKEFENPFSFALDDYIKLKKIQAEVSSRKPSQFNVRNVSVEPEQVTLSLQQPSKDDIFKSLDTIIQERGIAKVPKSYKDENGGGERDSSPAGFKRKYQDRDAEIPDDDTLKIHISNDRRITAPAQNRRPVKSSSSTGDQNKFVYKPLEFIMTPYRAVGFLSEKGMIIELEISKMSDPPSMGEERSHLWRCKVRCGAIEGVCESERKTVAREMACQDFLKKLKHEYPMGKIPRYLVSREVLIDPAILNIVEKKAAEGGIDLSHQVTVDADVADPGKKKRDGDHTYCCLYTAGNEEFEATSRYLEYAKLNAAAKVYERLTGESFPLTKYHTGKDCDETIQFEYIESEVHQTVEEVGGMEDSV